MRVKITEKIAGEHQILGSLFLTVALGETIALVGPSGIGKTTLLRIIAGVDQTYIGEVADVGRLAMVFQEPTLLPWRTAVQNIHLTTGIAHEQIYAVLESVGLSGKEHCFPYQLSLGQQRRLALARALAVKPTTLLMDEPFVSLDAETAGKIRTMTHDILSSKSIATIIVTHDLEDVISLAKRVVVLSGQPAKIIKEKSIKETDKIEDIEFFISDLSM